MIVSLRSEDLTSLGTMGAHTTTNWVKYFSSPEEAKKYAEKDYGKKIKWNRTKYGFQSPDLSYVMYTISDIEVVA